MKILKIKIPNKDYNEQPKKNTNLDYGYWDYDLITVLNHGSLNYLGHIGNGTHQVMSYEFGEHTTFEFIHKKIEILKQYYPTLTFQIIS